jgi:hypothetical protein
MGVYSFCFKIGLNSLIKTLSEFGIKLALLISYLGDFGFGFGFSFSGVLNWFKLPLSGEKINSVSILNCAVYRISGY